MYEALTNIEVSINSKMIEENQHGECNKYSVFEGLQGGNKQKFVAFRV